MVSEWSRKDVLYLTQSDDRYTKYLEQLKTRGFSDSETWALDSVVCKFILPRLIRFKQLNHGFPWIDGMTMEKWKAIIDEMIFAFDWSLNNEEDKYYSLTDEEKETNWKRYSDGMRLFAKYFRNLWW